VYSTDADPGDFSDQLDLNFGKSSSDVSPPDDGENELVLRSGVLDFLNLFLDLDLDLDLDMGDFLTDGDDEGE
jgi:hypothetical protein